MAAKINGSDDVVAEINVTPFIDVVLVLLVALMITSTAIVHAAIKVDLPKAASATDVVTSTINVTLAATGELLLDGTPSDRDGLARAVQRERATHEELVAVIAADRTVAYERVAEAIDVAKTNGATSIALNLAKAPLGEP